MTKKHLSIDITDWIEEHDRLESDVSSKEKLIEQVTGNKLSASRAAAVTIVARERGLSPADILPQNKALLLSGGAAAVSGLIARQRRKVRLENGAEVVIREHIAPVGEPGEEDHENDDTHAPVVHPPAPLPAQGFAPAKSPQGVQNALEYLRRFVPGYIEGRLNIIAAGGGDAEAAAEEYLMRAEERSHRGITARDKRQAGTARLFRPDPVW
jgi:hypothetical protein